MVVITDLTNYCYDITLSVTDGRYYIELFKPGDDGTERSVGATQKRPQVRCDRQHMAQRVSDGSVYS